MSFSGLSWSPDGDLLAFGAFIGKHRKAIYVVAADGNGLHAVPHTAGGINPVISSDGRTLAFARSRFRSHIDPKHPLDFHFYSSTTAWVLDLKSGRSHRLTPWRDGLANTPASFSPDGSVLALTRGDDRKAAAEAVLMRTDGSSGVRVIEGDAAQPVFSPDGTHIAFVSTRDLDVVGAGEDTTLASELYVMGADGTDVKRLTHTHDQGESAPSWDPSGQQIAYTQFRGGESLDALFPFGNRIMAINAEGTCRTEVLSVRHLALYSPTWQPGPGREAGRIAC